MAIWINTGTISISAGGTTVTGSGTSFLTGGAQKGDMLQAPDGREYEITNIVSDTQLSIFKAYQGTNVTDSSNWDIIPTQGYVKALVDEVRTYIESSAEIINQIEKTGLSIENGGTGATTASGARSNLGAASASDLTSHTTNTSNPHAVTKIQVGLGNVDNTSDLAKPISTATQEALNGKADILHVSNTSNPHAVTKIQVGLGNVDNTADLAKPISTATQEALNGKADAGTTLAEYGITDAYTKTEVNAALNNNIVVSAYQSTAVSLTVSTVTKMLFQTEKIDSHGIFANSRLTPTKAGWYRINCRVCVGTTGSTLTRCFLQLIKNGTVIYNDDDQQASAGIRTAQTSRLVQFNGTTDYLEAYLFVEGSGALTRITNEATIFEAEFVRS